MRMKVLWTHSIGDLFFDLGLVETRGGSSRWEEGDVVTYDGDGSVGTNIGIYAGHHIPSIGHLSFTHSELLDPFQIGNYCSIAEHVSGFGFEHPITDLSTSPIFYNQNLPLATRSNPLPPMTVPPKKDRVSSIVVGNDVWIGRGALIKSGVRIGDGAVIGAGSVVTKDVEAYSVVAGNPAQVKKARFTQDIIERLLETKWYHYDVRHLNFVDFSMPLTDLLNLLEHELKTDFLLPERQSIGDLVSAAKLQNST